MRLNSYTLRETFTPNPSDSFEEALARIETILSEEAKLDLHPEGSTRLLTHGRKTDSVIVFLHGMTNCPIQFAELGHMFFERGFNTYIPRLPRHGFKTRRGEPLKGLTAEEMARFAHQVVDIARGLGERVIVSGLSAGGVMAIYVGQERKDIEIVAPISPFLGIKFIPRRFNRSFANLALRLPDFWLWWDAVHKENNPFSAPTSYARYPLHALLEVLRLGYTTEAYAIRTPPAARKIIVITNENEESVNNDVTVEFVQLWREHNATKLVDYQFEKSLELPHDLIMPNRPGARIDLVYPKLIELIRS